MSLRINIFRLILPILLLLLLSSVYFPQPFQRELNIIPVSDSEGLIENIFSGGHNNIEHQFVDFDDDGDLDIFFLDSDQTFGCFKNTGDKFNPVFEYMITNPQGLFFQNWFYLTDIDDDGDPDYFTSNSDLISYYRNDGSPSSPLFVLAEDTVRDNIGNPIYSEFSSNPLFIDIDDDGDYDFFSGNSAGTVTFYENIGTPQNFNFQFITSIWQNLVIIGGQPKNSRHGASSLDFVDIDNDSDYDLFWGDFFSKSLYVIENQGTPSKPDMIRTSDIYPNNSDSISTSGFNMPRFSDIDGDNDFDLFVSVLYDPTVSQSLMFFENTGTSQFANHNLVTKDYLKTLDVGNNSAPVFADIDDDNDLDLFIGSLNNPIGSIHFLENIGSISNPSFNYSDSSYFDITSDLSLSPAFGDIDNDADLDLLIGKLNGTTEIILNSGTPSSPNFSSGNILLNNLGQPIDVGSSATPILVDVDNDFDLDLIIGAFNGRFSFYENTGNSNIYEFTSNTDYFGSLDVGDNSTPILVDFNKDGFLDLFSGNRNGKFFYFRNDGTNSLPIWTEITNNFLSKSFGGNSAPCFVDIDNDTDLDLFLGNVKGGIYLYINSEITSVANSEIKPADNYSLQAFPNPFNPGTQIRIETKEAKKIIVEIFNLLGENVKTLNNEYLPAGVNNFNWFGDDDLGNVLPSGIYFVLASSASEKKAIKVTFLK